MTLEAEAQRLLREAMNRYGFCDADAGHVTDGGPCWCSPLRVCSDCATATPCLHGTERVEVVVHTQAS